MVSLVQSLADLAEAGSKVSHLWINAVAARFADLDLFTQQLEDRIEALELRLNTFKLTAGAGRVVNYTGGLVLLPSGNEVQIAPGSVTAPDNTTSWIAIRPLTATTADVIATTTRPPIVFKLGTVTTLNGAITLLTQSPRIDQLLSEPMTVLQATKGTLTNLPADGISRGLPGWTEAIDIFNAFDANNGTFTVPHTDTYQILAKSVIISDVVSSFKSKLWIASGSTEIALLGESSAGVTTNAFRTVYNGWFEGQLVAGQVVSVQSQVDQASNARILADANTQLIIRRGQPR